MQLRYHEGTLKLLGVSPQFAPEAVTMLDQVEQRIGRRLPAAVREWYSLDGALELLLKYSNDDPPVAPEQWGEPRKDTHRGGPHDLLAQHLIVFRYENQAVCVWSFELDGSDDPPVLVDFDSQFRQWTSCGVTFSQHLHASMWDYALVLKKDLLIQAQNREVTGEALAFLRANFTPQAMTHGWPGHTQYRFSRGDQRILIWASEGQADWWLSAENETSLTELVRAVWACDEVGESMWSHSERGEALLAGIR